MFFFLIYISLQTPYSLRHDRIIQVLQESCTENISTKKTNLKHSSNRGMKENKYRGPALSGRLAALAGGDLWRRLSVVQVLVLTTICCSAVLCHCTRVRFHHSLVLQPVLSCIATTRVLLSSFTFVSVR